MHGLSLAEDKIRARQLRRHSWRRGGTHQIRSTSANALCDPSAALTPVLVLVLVPPTVLLSVHQIPPHLLCSYNELTWAELEASSECHAIHSAVFLKCMNSVGLTC